MSSPLQPKPADPAEEGVDLGEESDDYDAEFDGEEEEDGVYEEYEEDEEEEDEEEEEVESGGGGLTALLLGDGGEEADEEEEYEAGGLAEAQPVARATGTKRALDETADDGADVDKNGGGEDSGAKKAKVS